MYKHIVRTIVRRGIERLNAGDPSALLKMAADDVELSFPGDNSWSNMFRPVVLGRERHATHRGRQECEAFARRFVAERIQFHVEDILVNGPPWRTRVVVRASDYREGRAGDDYNNRVISFMEIRWGKLRSWEDYEDTQRTAAWDAVREEGASVNA